MAEENTRRVLEQTSAEEIAPIEAVLDPAYPERLRDIATSLYLELIGQDELRQMMGLPRLAQLALALTERVSTDLGGSYFYMHKGTSYRLTSRDRAMCAKFNGRNYHQLAREHDLTEMRVRQIVNAWQLDAFSRRQGNLGLD